jgi:hypothetical protein
MLNHQRAGGQPCPPTTERNQIMDIIREVNFSRTRRQIVSLIDELTNSVKPVFAGDQIDLIADRLFEICECLTYDDVGFDTLNEGDQS